MSWGVKTTCFKAPGVSLGGSGVSIGGVRILRVAAFFLAQQKKISQTSTQWNYLKVKQNDQNAASKVTKHLKRKNSTNK